MAATADARRRLVERVASSRHFEKAHRLRDFLLYVCERAIENRPEEATERQIGIHVFGRPADFNAGEDSVVRSQARLLRMRLESYFRSEGRDEPVVIRIPTGSYLPVFEPRTAGMAGEAGPAVRPARRPVLAPVLAAACVILAALAGYLAYRLQQVRPAPGAAQVPPLLWSRMFGGGLPTTLVIPDNTYAMHLEAAKKAGNLRDYLRRTWPESPEAAELERILPNFKVRRYTTTDVVSAAVRLARIAPQFGGELRIRHARDLSVADLGLGHLVILGQPNSNPWMDSFSGGLNYRMEADWAARVVLYRNLAPEPGEPSVYRSEEGDGQRTVYAAAAFRANGKRGANVLLISGVGGGRASALELLCNPRLFGVVAERLLAGSGTAELPYFELLIRTHTIDAVSRDPAVVGYRPLRE